MRGIAKHLVLNGLRHITRQRQMSGGFEQARKNCKEERDKPSKDPAYWTCNSNRRGNTKCKTLAFRSITCNRCSHHEGSYRRTKGASNPVTIHEIEDDKDGC